MPVPFPKRIPRLTDEEKLAILAIQDASKIYEDALDKFTAPGREQSLAITYIEQSVMWAIKSITG